MSRRPRHNTSGRTYIPSTTPSLDAIEQRVYGVEKGQSTLAERIDALATGLDARIDRLAQAMERRSQPPYQAITVLLLVLVPMIGGVFALLSASQSRLDRDIASVNATLIREVAEINAKVLPRDQIDDRQAMSDRHMEQMAASLLRLQESVFPREVHQERWAAIAAENDHVREEVASVRAAVQAISPASSTLQNLVDRIERLESRWIDRRMPGTEAP